MIYLFYGIEDYLIQKEIDSIKQKNNIEEISISRYDLTNTNIEKIIEDCEMNSMFTDKKVIIVNNSYIFTGQSKKGQIEQNLEALEKYLNNPNIDTLLIFISDSEKLDERKKIVKLIKQKGIVKFQIVQYASICEAVLDMAISNFFKEDAEEKFSVSELVKG